LRLLIPLTRDKEGRHRSTHPLYSQALQNGYRIVTITVIPGRAHFNLFVELASISIAMLAKAGRFKRRTAPDPANASNIRSMGWHLIDDLLIHTRAILSTRVSLRQRTYIPLFSPHEFIWRRPLEKLNPWLHHLDRYVEALV